MCALSEYMLICTNFGLILSAHRQPCIVCPHSALVVRFRELSSQTLPEKAAREREALRLAEGELPR
jgi:regulator of extracellular matrix RemA (YlzA/DUF370 family)